jgi:hypothetical protein
MNLCKSVSRCLMGLEGSQGARLLFGIVSAAAEL